MPPGLPLAVKDTERFFCFSAFGDSNIDIFVFLRAIDRTGSFALKGELIKGIHHRFKEEGIEINYPVAQRGHVARLNRSLDP